MADLTTYEGLKAAVADYLGRDDLGERIPTFIRLAEKRMERELRLRVMERRAECDVAAGQGAVALPWRREPGSWDVFLEMRDLVWRGADGFAHDLSYAPPDHYAVSREPGRPLGYSIVGRELFLLPAPREAGTLLLTYYAEIPPLSEAQPDNAVLLAAPDVYLYGALAEAGPFTRGSAPTELWAQYYAAARNKLELAEQRARYTANLSMRPARRI